MAKKKLAKKATRARKTAQTRKRDAKPDNVLRIDYVPLSSLQAAPRNPKLHSSDLARSVDRWGFADAPILDGRTGRLVAGHGRKEALEQRKAEGLEPPAGVKVKGGEWLVPVQAGWSSRSDAEAEAFLLAHNKLTEAGGWDEEELAKAIRDLKTADVDLSGIGFDAKELRALAASLNVPPGGEPGPAEPPAKPKSKAGELYELGPHRLLCGDCTVPENVDLLLGAMEPDLVCTDPPYGLGGYSGRSGKHLPVSGDDQAPEDIQEMLRASIPESPRAFIWCEWRTYPNFLSALGEPTSLIVWAKPWPGMGRGYRRRHEFALFYGEFSASDQWDLWQVDYREDGARSTWERTQKCSLHPTQKPLELFDRAILNHSPAAGLVYDPFLGSGTTLIAAARQNRTCYGMELSPAYCDVIRKRWGDYARANDLDPGKGAL